MQIRTAGPTDLREIKRWLELEAAEEGAGFLCNFNMIEEGFAHGTLTVAADDHDTAMSMYLSAADAAASPNILTTNPERRGLGAARLLATHFIDAAQRVDALGMLIETKPETSIPFWQKLGFVPCPEAGLRRMMLLLPTTRESLAGASARTIVIEHYKAHSTGLKLTRFGGQFLFRQLS